MQNVILAVGWNKIALGALLLLVLFIAFFKLDTLIGAPRRRGGPERPASGRDRQGRPFYSDPDGKPWKRRRKA
jgi:hypothetical protein